MNKNKYGLTRYINPVIELKIRQNSKFGCVVPNCRNSFYTYEHLIPEFKDAKVHDPDKICLACPNHNPQRTGKYGQENYSKKQLIEFYENIKSNTIVPEIKNKDFFNGFKEEPIIKIGNSTFLNIKSIINIDGENVFSFQKNIDNNPFAPNITFTGKFNDSEGNLLFQITNNEWDSPTYHWDVQNRNGKISIWDKSKKLVFRAIKIPDKNTIEITHLDLWFNPFHLKIEDNDFYVGRYTNNLTTWSYIAIKGYFKHGNCGVFMDSKIPFVTKYLPTMLAIGGKGATIKGTGILLGKGSIMGLENVNILFSEDFMQKPLLVYPKKVATPKNSHYFVRGILKTKRIDFKLWQEDEFYLNGQKLDSRPNSWGKINSLEHLYYIASNETEDLTLNSGFIGFYADDILKQPFANKVFEVEVKDIDLEGNALISRVKRNKIGKRKIVSEINFETGKYFHPHQFFGSSPWKKQSET
tara:strand:- start:27202 stop:28608 length:1407 start_codon:yes stop_codon:yes gene_type:complete